MIGPLHVDPSLLSYADDRYSQHGEDGIVRRIFEVIGTSTERCCEFGAWDGIHLSNTRALILDGWSAVLIEGEPDRAAELRQIYADFTDVHCVNSTVDAGNNRLAAVLEREALPADFDLISIDIDGLDYEVFESLGVRAPVICVEVGVLLHPDRMDPVPPKLAARNVGQSLARFRALGERLGYKLVCYTGNAFFVRRDLAGASALTAVAPTAAYAQNLARLSYVDRFHLHRTNLGLQPPYRSFQNPYLTLGALGLPERDDLRFVWARRQAARARRAAFALKTLVRPNG